jgi:hypothetical protein
VAAFRGAGLFFFMLPIIGLVATWEQPPNWRRLEASVFGSRWFVRS